TRISLRRFLSKNCYIAHNSFLAFPAKLKLSISFLSSIEPADGLAVFEQHVKKPFAGMVCRLFKKSRQEQKVFSERSQPRWGWRALL
ncbi:MAG: hypothetical protein WCY05_03390, partial [Candidatus Omnitrophota bacterium]